MDQESSLSTGNTSSYTKSAKPVRRASKRASSGDATIHHHNQVPRKAGIDGQRKRVRKACERCRMKKTKCDGNFPCKPCKDGGLICTASIGKKGGYKKLPPEYAAVLTNTQLVLIATIHKLYSMVRNNESWGLDEPGLNDKGQPVVHNIAQKLDCIRSRSDIDIPLCSVFPEDGEDMAKLVLRLAEKETNNSQKELKDTVSSICSRNEWASSSESGQSEFECDYQRADFGNNNSMRLSAQRFTGSSSDFVFEHPLSEIGASTMLPVQSPLISQSSLWPMAVEPKSSDLAHTLNQSPVESQSGTIESRALSCPGPQLMWGMNSMF